MSSFPTICLECDAEIPPEAQGLCPKCLLKFGLASQFGSASSPASPGNSSPPAMPFHFGGYRIECLLGKGGMGAVYGAEDLAGGRRVALKVLGHSLDSSENRKRFLREGRLAASINHPNTVYVYGTEEIEGTPVITMEIVDGGTLHDRVKARGPMPVTEALDAILQIIAGLEGAHAVGILHRDIKPSNCFVDSDGIVKVGDFGLSISTTARGDSALTLAGSVLGTPEFSSPEQLRGEALDLRTDIYSVGMTLYYLLTGKTAFQAESLVQLLATALDKPAPSPRTHRSDIPEKLARVILRCLEKQAGDRFKTYDQLRHQLLPFTSTAATPATLALRFVAGVIDQLVFMAVAAVGSLIFGGIEGVAQADTLRTQQWLWFCLALLVFEISYFAIGEGRWGATLGKALVGLRVAGSDRNAPGIPRALLRAVIFMGPAMGPALDRLLRNHEFAGPESLAWNLAFWLYLALLWVTARPHNGFATVIDLLTKTRVVQKTAYGTREAVGQIDEPLPTSDAMAKLGPFHVLGQLAAADGYELLLGYDTKLLRRVWIRKITALAAPVPTELRHTGRPGRLRWLQGHRDDTVAWDAYEAVPGTALTALLRAPQPWKVVRHWLLDLTDEFLAANRDGSMPPFLSLDRVWITARGGAKLLDFSAPGADSTEAIPCAETAAFLNQLAISALEGRIASPHEARISEPRVPVALRARSLLEALRTATDLSAIAEALKTLVQKQPAISRGRRLGVIIGCVIGAQIMAPFTIVGLTILGGLQNRNRAALAVAVDKGGEHNLARPSSKSNEPSRLAILLVAAFTAGCLVTALLSAGAALFFHGGLLLRALGVAVVTCDGSDASRWRMLWRACVAWSWLPLGAVLVALLAPTLQPIPAVAIAGVLAIGTVAASAALPARSLQDRLAGTWLVPR